MHPTAHQLWAHTYLPFGPPPTSDVWAFCTAYVADYLAEHYHPAGLCDDCDRLDVDTVAEHIVQSAADTELDDTDNARFWTAVHTPGQIRAGERAAIALRAVTAIEATVTDEESGRYPWMSVLDAHAADCPDTTRADDELTYRLTT